MAAAVNVVVTPIPDLDVVKPLRASDFFICACH